MCRKIPINGTAQLDRQNVVFTDYCSSCHGLEGDGRGPAAESFPVKPRDLTATNWQSGARGHHAAANYPILYLFSTFTVWNAQKRWLARQS